MSLISIQSLVETDFNQIGDNGHHHRKLSLIKLTGLILFLIGIAVFLSSLFFDNYKITPSSLSAVADKIPEERLLKVEPLIGKTYKSKFILLDKIQEKINDDNVLSSYDLGQYKFWILKSSATGLLREKALLFFIFSFVVCVLGGLIYIFPQFKEGHPGIKHNNIYFSSLMSRGIIGIIIGIMLIGFYVALYWYPESMVNLIILVDPISYWLRNRPADQWFLYGLLYTLAILVMGIRMYAKYRHSNYHIVRTTSVMFFQLCFAFLIPTILERFNKPSTDFKNIWPLDYDLFMDWNLNYLLSSGNLGLFMLFWGVVLIIIVVPILTYFYGKRWYCSWVCGCGGLAETLGDPFRQLSDKSVNAWKIERLIIHSVLVFAVVMTIMQIANYTSNGSIFGNSTWRVNQVYSFLIGAVFAGVIGVGFYPLMGNRVWCRFGCPLAAILGLIQKYKSRFRITTNGGQCISCGNCSTYCEMGIDVRWYAQRGQNIIRTSCVGCGVCAAVCPRGVLRLENGPEKGRYNVKLEADLIN